MSYPLTALAAEDAAYVKSKAASIRALNGQLNPVRDNTQATAGITKMWLAAVLSLLLAGALVFLVTYKGKRFLHPEKLRYAYPVLAVGIVTSLFGFSKAYKKTTVTNPYFIDSAFAPYRTNVHTRWDSTWFYVESYGIGAHEMMAGIVSWQQQVPIPQCYTGANAWSIPLNPVLAATPMQTAHHFFRGAIAIAANGVPIFNALTNTGVDAYLDGQLDSFGGHSGRADDYHYHTAPLHLQSLAGTKPIAFALDGYAVYGTVEPNGTPAVALDTNHGHFWAGVYHYHGTMTYPYMIGNMVGRVTEDTTFQIIPQAAARPVRPGQTPLPGAVITHCQQVGTNGYKLTYTLSGISDTVSYSWTTGGIYTFNFISPTSGTTTQTYTGFIPCYMLPTAVSNVLYLSENVVLYPNPARQSFSFSYDSRQIANEVTDIAIYNIIGQAVYQSKNSANAIEIGNMPKGIYTVTFRYNNEQLVRKLAIE